MCIEGTPEANEAQGDNTRTRALDARTRRALKRGGFDDPAEVLEFLELVAPILVGHGRQTPAQYHDKLGWSNLQSEDWGRKRYAGVGLFLSHATGGTFAVAACCADYSRVVTIDLDAGAELEARYQLVRETLGAPSAVIGSPGAGLHVHFISTEPRWTATVYPLLAAKLRAAGVEVAAGSCEIFPRPPKPGASRALLRLPFVSFRWVIDAGADLSTGRMLDPDTLEPLHRTPAEGVALFVGARREDWAVRWELERFNNSGQHAPRVHVPRCHASGGYADLDSWRRLRDSTTPADAELKREQYKGEEFARVTAALEKHGLQAAGQRHSGSMMVGYSLAMRGMVATAADAGEGAAGWLQCRHNGLSSTYNRSPAIALADTRAAAAWGAQRYFDTKATPAAPAKRRGNHPQARHRHEVTDAERRYLGRLVRGRSPVSARKCWRSRQLWRATVAMVSLLELVGADGRRRLSLSKAQLLELPGWSSGGAGTYSRNVALAEAVGLWRLTAEGIQSPAPSKRRPRQWLITWSFRGSRSFPARRDCQLPHKKISKPLSVCTEAVRLEGAYGRPDLLAISRAPP